MNGEKNSYYFPHDMGARHDERIAELIMERGYEGYGVWWAVVETLAQATDYKISRDRTKALAFSMHLPHETLQAVLETCLRCGLLVEKDGELSSKSLTRRMQALEDKKLKKIEQARKAGLASAAARCSTDDEQELNGSPTPANGQSTNKREREERGEKIYERYKESIRPGARADAVKNIVKRLGEYTPEELEAAVDNYAAVVKKKKTERDFRVQANNFFGTDERFKEYLSDGDCAPPPPPQRHDDPDLPEHLRGHL